MHSKSATAVNICPASVESSVQISAAQLTVNGSPVVCGSTAVPHIRTPAVALVAGVLSPCLSADAEIPCRGRDRAGTGEDLFVAGHTAHHPRDNVP